MGESFFQRWSRRKAEQASDAQTAEHAVPANAGPPGMPTQGMRNAGAPNATHPTLEDVGRLTGESDYSLFVSEGIDRDVRRAAMKKLFADPHFNRMDGLDIYIDDYTKPSPLAPAMLAALRHTESMFAAIARDEDAACAAQAAAAHAESRQQEEGLEKDDPPIAQAEDGQEQESESDPLVRAEQAVGMPDGWAGKTGERHP